jgi:DedD protein
MVLDSEPKPTVQDIDLRIPASDKVGKFVPGVAVSEVAETLPLATYIAAPASAPPAVAQADSAKPVADNQQAASANPKVEAQGKIQSVADKQPEIKEPESKVTESKATEPKEQVKPESIEAYVVQVGAYSSAATAKQELGKLKAWGFKAAYIEKIGVKERVRVGPYAERGKAEKVRQLLEKHGLHPVVMGK